MRSTRKWAALMTGLTLGLAFLAFPATSRADVVSIGQYGTVTWTLNAKNDVASFTFAANSGYMLIDSNVADLNVNASSWTISNFAVTQPAGFNTQSSANNGPWPKDGGAGNVGGGVGAMNQTVNAFDGFGSAMST